MSTVDSKCMTIQYNSQIVTCGTRTDELLLGTGNLASGLTDLIAKKTVKCNVVGKLPTGPVAVPVPGPPINPFSGGNSSSQLLNAQIRAQQECTAAANRALALQRIANPVTSPPLRFAQYQRRVPVVCPAPAPGTIIKLNPAIPDAINGPCTIIPGIVTTWPPH